MVLAPAGKLTVSLMLPAPLAVQVPPPAPTHVQAHVRTAGEHAGATVAPVAATDEALDAVMV